MSTPSSWDDAQIHAYVDGELDAQTATRLEAASRDDAALAARIARQRELRALLRGAFDPVLEEPVPQRLRDALAQPAAGATVTPIGAPLRQRKARPAWSVREWSAVAATLVLGLLVGALAFRNSTSLPLDMAQGRLLARGELDAALSTQLSGGAAADAPTRIGLSFRAADGAWCRSFSRHDGPTGLACRRDGRWAVQLLEDGHPQATGDAGDYRQAASSLSPIMLGAISALGAGDALTPEQEQQQVDAGWD
jgi:hypothetical protein